MMENPTLWAVLSYLLGSIPFGLVLTRAAGLGDIRAIGSGNIGATNVLRTGRRGLALATLLLDALKGAIAVLCARALVPTDMMLPLIAGVSAFLGHIFPIWLRFKGGKGVATYIGTLFALHWILGLVCSALWLLTLWAFKRSSLSALVAVIGVPMVAWWQDTHSLAIALTFMSALVVARHAQNIRRLLKGEEPMLSFKKSTS